MSNVVHVIKLNPNKTQAVGLAKAVGAARYAWNWGLAKWNELYERGEKRSAYELCRLWVQERPEWALNQCAQSLQRSFFRLQGAFRAYFEKRAGQPKFRKRGPNDSAYFSNQSARLLPNKQLYIPKIGNIRMREKLRYEDYKLMYCVVKREADGWYVVVDVEIEDKPRTESTTFVGVDVGCKNFAVASDGTVCKTPAQLKDIEKQIKRRHRLMDRKKRGSNNHRKAANKLARAYQKQRRVKHDAIHKFTAAIAKNHGTVCIESLDIASMQTDKKKAIRKGVQNSAMGLILWQLKYKCNNFIKVAKTFPSSKTCSNCGNIKSDLTLSDRTYHCPSCGHTIDRDLNAAINLRNEGLRIYTVGHTGSACGETSAQLELAL